MLKFSSKPVMEHAEVPLGDGGRWENLVSHFEEKGATAASSDNIHRDYVVSVGTERDPTARRAQLGEIVSLVESAGHSVMGEEICTLHGPNPRTLIGKGAAEEIAERARACGSTMLVVDAELSPSQTRNLEDVAKLPICDREAIILNVFLRHARTRRTKIQVEIAQLEFLKPRIRGVGIDMDQQTGGMARARGPGETASELLARKLDSRILELHKSLRKLETSGEAQRKQRSDAKRIVLVGYTNAGKTSLMNALAATDLSARDIPFETLDTTSRAIARHGGDIVLCDTVGFIRRLPERLLASFESTLAEIAEASLVVVVVDASDYERALHLETTRTILGKIGANHVPRLYVWNKIDRATPVDVDALAELADGSPCHAVSTRDPILVRALKERLIRAARSEDAHATLRIPYAASEMLAEVYARCRISDTSADADSLTLTVEGPAHVVARIQAQLKEITR